MRHVTTLLLAAVAVAAGWFFLFRKPTPAGAAVPAQSPGVTGTTARVAPAPQTIAPPKGGTSDWVPVAVAGIGALGDFASSLVSDAE
jgi:hypothetical protein